ncbi:anti-sigma factor [Microbacterium sp. NPDC090007]|uniref:anti-sigma factor n=1 Tax=Microbacterium sp. NPDC090007 TaxID=3364204 RepID=UPI003815E2A5
MSHPDSEILALMAMGESVASPEDRAHVEGCPGCLEELASLTHAVAVGRASIDVGDLERPHARVWSRIADELELSEGARGYAASPTRGEATAPPHPVDEPDVPGGPVVPVAARRSRPDEPGGPVAPVASRRSRRRPGRPLFRGGWVLAAALALVVGVGLATWTISRAAAPTTVAVAEAALDALPDHPGARGTAEVDRGDDGAETITVTLAAPSTPTGYHEVWLITADATRLVSLGILDGDAGTFPIPAGVDLGRYSLVDISDEPVNGDPTHSGDSIVRGQLTFS